MKRLMRVVVVGVMLRLGQRLCLIAVCAEDERGMIAVCAEDERGILCDAWVISFSLPLNRSCARGTTLLIRRAGGHADWESSSRPCSFD